MKITKKGPEPARPISRDEVRDVDRRAVEEFRMPSVLLMENAARGAAELLLELGVRGPAAICCGRGNNGGDGFAMARHLENRGVEVRVLLFAEPRDLKGDAAINYGILEAARTPIVVLPREGFRESLDAELARAEWIVDALLGTGMMGAVREPFATAIEAINAAGKRVLAVDIPSGLDCDTGEPLGICVRTEHTATFVARKIGFDNPSSAAYTGAVHVIDIGVPRAALR